MRAEPERRRQHTGVENRLEHDLHPRRTAKSSMLSTQASSPATIQDNFAAVARRGGPIAYRNQPGAADQVRLVDRRDLG